MNRETLITRFFDGASAMKRHMFSANSQKHMLPHAQLGVLFAVSHAGHATVKDLAQNFCMTSSGATQLVNALVKDGLLTRKADSEDRRKIMLSLTPKGKKMLERATHARRVSMEQLLNPLTDVELAQLCTIQEKILAPLRNV